LKTYAAPQRQITVGQIYRTASSAASARKEFRFVCSDRASQLLTKKFRRKFVSANLRQLRTWLSTAARADVNKPAAGLYLRRRRSSSAIQRDWREVFSVPKSNSIRSAKRGAPRSGIGKMLPEDIWFYRFRTIMFLTAKPAKIKEKKSSLIS